jgi:hypothetical protein
MANNPHFTPAFDTHMTKLMILGVISTIRLKIATWKVLYPRPVNQVTASDAHKLVTRRAPNGLPSPNVPLSDIFGHPHTISYYAASTYLTPKHLGLIDTISLPISMPTFTHPPDKKSGHGHGTSTFYPPDVSPQLFGLLVVLVGVIGAAAYARLLKKRGHTKKASSDHELIAFLQSELAKAATKNSELSETLQRATTATTDLSLQLRAANSQVMDTQADHDAAEQASMSSIIELQTMRRENDRLRRQNYGIFADLVATTAGMRNQKLRQDHHIIELCQMIDDKKREIVDFSRQTDNLETERKALITQRERLRTSLGGLQRDIVELSSQNSTLSSENIQLVLETKQHLATFETQEEEWEYDRCTITALVVDVQAKKATLQHSLDFANERHRQDQDKIHTQIRIAEQDVQTNTEQLESWKQTASKDMHDLEIAKDEQRHLALRLQKADDAKIHKAQWQALKQKAQDDLCELDAAKEKQRLEELHLQQKQATQLNSELEYMRNLDPERAKQITETSAGLGHQLTFSESLVQQQANRLRAADAKSVSALEALEQHASESYEEFRVSMMAEREVMIEALDRKAGEDLEQLRIEEEEENRNLKLQLSQQTKSKQALADEKETALAENEEKSKQIHQMEDEVKTRQANVQTVIGKLQGQMESLKEQEKTQRVISENELKAANDQMRGIQLDKDALNETLGQARKQALLREEELPSQSKSLSQQLEEKELMVEDSKNTLEKTEAEYSQKTAASHSRSHQIRHDLDASTKMLNLQAVAISDRDREIQELREAEEKLRAEHENELADLRREVQILKGAKYEVRLHREKARLEATEDQMRTEVEFQRTFTPRNDSDSTTNVEKNGFDHGDEQDNGDDVNEGDPSPDSDANLEHTEESARDQVEDNTEAATEKTVDKLAGESAEETVQKPSGDIVEPESGFGLILDQLKDMSFTIPSPKVSQEFLDFLKETQPPVGKGILREWPKTFICRSIVRRGPYAQDHVLELQLPCYDPLYNNRRIPMPSESTDPNLKCSECDFCHQRYTYADRQDHLKMCLTFFNGFGVCCAGYKKVFVNNDAFRAVHQSQCPKSVVVPENPPTREDSVLECSLAGVDESYDISAINALKDAKLDSIRDTQLVPSKRPHEDRDFIFLLAHKELPKPSDAPKLPLNFNGDTWNNKKRCRLCKKWYLCGEKFSTHLAVCQQFFYGREGFVPHVLCENCDGAFCTNEHSTVHVHECSTLREQCVHCKQAFNIQGSDNILHRSICPENAQNNFQDKKAGKGSQANKAQTQAIVYSSGMDTQPSAPFTPNSNMEFASFQAMEFASFQPSPYPSASSPSHSRGFGRHANRYPRAFSTPSQIAGYIPSYMSPTVSPLTPSPLSGQSRSSAQVQEVQNPVDDDAQPPNSSSTARRITSARVGPIRNGRPAREVQNPTSRFVPAPMYSPSGLDKRRRLPDA